MKIYTKTGDKGETGLVGGGRIGKESALMQAIGDVDELNAALGVCLATFGVQSGEMDGVAGDDVSGLALKILYTVQKDLFDLGADLATPVDVKFQTVRITAEQVLQLEHWIDELSAPLEPLQHFILPGGSGAGAHLHLARTVCRRAERGVVGLGKVQAHEESGAKSSVNEKNGDEKNGGGLVNSQIQIYLNRLSDLLFAMARAVNKAAGVGETKWKG